MITNIKKIVPKYDILDCFMLVLRFEHRDYLSRAHVQVQVQENQTIKLMDM